ncbi:hypothetical protein AY600_14145 [Phormidium willei BDU 130791]|nr:hypothetical protein AY600_14145 [Phormidium willei BDU 130791]
MHELRERTQMPSAAAEVTARDEAQDRAQDRALDESGLEERRADAGGRPGEPRVVDLNPGRLRHFGPPEGASFVFVTNADLVERFRFETQHPYHEVRTLAFDGETSFEDFLERNVPEPAHILLVSPHHLVVSPEEENLGKRKLIVMPCNSTPTDFGAVAHFLKVMERSDPEREEAFVDAFFELGRASEQLEFVDERYGTRAVFRHLNDDYEWNQQAGPVGWGEQQIAPSGELSAVPGSIMEFDPSLVLDIEGELALQGVLAIHSGAPSYLEEDRKRLHQSLATIRDHAVIAKVRGGKIVELTASDPACAPAARTLEAMIELDSRYATLWECGFGINTELSLLEGNIGMNEPYGGAHGCSHWGVGLTPFTQYALIILCPGTRVLGKDGRRLVGPDPMAEADRPVRRGARAGKGGMQRVTKNGACGCYPG